MTELETESIRVSRVIDFRIPLPYLITGVLAVGGLLINNHFTLQQVVKDLNQLQNTERSASGSTQQINAELVMLKYRLETLEKASTLLPPPRKH